jgi:hypothetical protein
VTGDLKGVSAKFKDPVDLQQRMLFPQRKKPVQVTVTAQGSVAVTGDLVRIDDFDVALRDASGQYRSFKRSPNVRVETKDPLQTHYELLDQYTDKDMHDLVRYLETLK